MEEVKIPISLEDGGFENGAKRILDRMEDTQREVKKTGMSVDDFAKHMQEVYRRFDKLTAAVHENTAAIGQDSRAAKQLGRDLDETTEKGVAGFGRLEKAAIGFFTVQKAKEFVGKVYEVRSEIEKLETSFRILVGDKAKADALLASIRKFAVDTPMQMKVLAGAAQTMMGFGIATEDVMENLKALGNISMGDSQKFQSLALAFSQMSATGKLMGQDFLQMVNAGFNPLDQMAKTTGKSMAELKKEMSEGAISADMVRRAFIDATSEGGKFNGMLEAQSKDLAGAYSNMQGAIEDMFNKIGQNTEGIMKGAIDVATLLAKNYETVGRVLLQLVATYGSYKVAVMAVTAAEAVLNGTYTLKIRLLRAAVVVQQLLNKTMLANPYVAVGTALMSVVSALAIFSSRADEATESQKRLKESFDNTQAEIAAEQKEIDRLFDKLRKAEKGTREYKAAKDAILSQYGDYLKGLGKEVETLGNVEVAYKAVARAAREAALARGREAALGEANAAYGKTYADNMGKLQKALTDKAGKREAANALKQIQKELRETGSISSQTEARVRKLLSGSFDYGSSGAWFTTLRNNEKELQDAIERTNELFKQEDKGIDDEADKAKNLGKVYADAREQYETAFQKIEKMKQARANYTTKEWEEAQEALKKAKEAYVKVGGDPDGKQQRKDDAAAKKLAQKAKEEAMLSALMEKQKTERERAVKDMEFSTEQATIDALEDGTEKTLRQLRLNFEKQKEEIERGYQDLKQAKIEEAKRLWDANPVNKNKQFDATTVDTSYTAEEKANYEALMKANNAAYRRAMQERQKMEAQAMIDYLKEYGSLAQQKYAIEKEYNEKIAKEQDEWRKKQLEAEKQSRLSQMDAQDIAQNIDWHQTFSGIGNVLEDIAKDTLKKVEKYMKSPEFKALSAQDKQAYSDLRNQLIDAGGISASNPFSKQTWDDIAQAAERYRNSINVLNDANEHAEEVRLRLNAAEKEAAANPADLRFQLVVDGLKKEFESVSREVENARANVGDSQSDLRVKTDSLTKGFGDFNTILGQITSGSLSGFALAVGNLIKKISGSEDDLATDFGALFGEAGKQIGGLIGAILQIIDILGTEPAKFIDDLLGKIADVLEAVLSQLPEIIASAIKGVGNIIGGIFTGLGGLVAGLFGGGADWSAYEEAMDKWGYLLDSWESNLKYERELMEKAYGKDAIDVSEKALKFLENTQKAAAEIYRGWAGSGAGWFSHSNGYNVNSDTNWNFLWQYDQDLARKMGVSPYELFGKTYYAGGDVSRLFDLTWQELEKLKNEAPQFWNSLHSDAQNYLDQYIEAGKAAEETIAALNEQLTTTTKEDVFDDFLNSLYELADGSEDVFDNIADNWQKMVNRMVINNLIAKDFQQKLESWYAELGKLQSDYNNGYIGEGTYKSRLEALKNTYLGYLTDAEDQIGQFTEWGIIKPIDDAVEEAAKEYFSSLRDSWLDTLTDMEADGEAWKREIQRVMFEDLVNEFILTADFDTWLEKWKEAYKAALEAGDEERLTQLLEEQIQKREELAGKAQELADRIGYEKLAEEAGNAFSDIRSSLLDTLMDMDADAESWGKKIRETLLEEMVEKTIIERMGLGELMEAYGTKLLSYITDESLTDAQRQQNIDGILSEMEDAFGKASELVQKMRDALGIGKKEDDSDSPFKDLREQFLSTLMDMENDAEDFQKDLIKNLTQSLVEKFILNENFDKYLEDLNKRYMEILNGGLSEEQTAAAMNRLAAEWEAKAKEMQEHTQAIFDLTGWSSIVDQMNSPLADLRSSFRSALMDMENDTEDFANEISKLLTEAFIDRFVLGDEFDKRLAEWQEQYAAIMKGNYSEDERASLLKHLQQAIAAAKEGYAEEAQAIHDLMGTGNAKDQTATMNMADKATYDQFETYLGIAVAQQMATLQGNDVREQILATLRGLTGITTPGGDTVKEIRSLLNTTNEYLLDIKRSNRAILEQFGLKIDNIISKLTKIV